MIEIKGKRNSAIVFADKIDKETKTKLAAILREEAFADSRIRIMPDAHAGKTAVVGTTITLTNRIIPALLGVDLGCGMEVVFLQEREVDLPKLDEAIHALVPCGAKIHAAPLLSADAFDFDRLYCKTAVNKDRALKSLGTLGGGNHFIELDKTENGELVLVIHCGSRQAGSDVATYYKALAYREQCKKERKEKRKIFYDYDEDDHACRAVRREQKTKLDVTRENAVLKGRRFEEYLHDVALMQEYADLNRKTISNTICSAMGFHVKDRFSCAHNYIDAEHMILRKGAISARLHERVIIPLNMRDGAILGTGMGNPNWNFSAPHGAGRACSRIEAKHTYTVEEYQAEMSGIYTTTATAGSLDECPMAYKPPKKILDVIGETVNIEQIIRPVYNFKSC
ncbi:MAG: RtcB family protein [Clostridia bacterium]|nr:RtcB family protein [Clostridia bacterium]